jgi:O-antigen/teichoic acid export membrane protein
LQKRPKKFAAFRIINVLVLTALNIYFLFYAYDPAIGIEYVFWANLLANLFYLVFFLPVFLQWRPRLDRVVFPDMARYAYPIMLTGLAGMMNEFFSRITLEKWLPENFYEGKSSAHALGVFGACYKFSVIMNLTVQAFRMAAEPFFFSHASDKNSPGLFARVNHYFTIVACFILLVTCINLDILKYIFLQQEEYWEGLVIVPPLLLGYLFLGIYYNLSVWFKLTDKTVFGTVITVAGALLTITLNFILIPSFGYLGSSWATAAVYFFMMALCYSLGQKYFPIPYHVLSGVAYIVLTMLLVYAVNSFSFANQWQTTGFHAGVMTAYLVVVYLIERKQWRSSPA